MDRRTALAGLLGISMLTEAATASVGAVSLEPLGFATGWYGQRPPVSSLRGRVVVVDVFTFECSNCANVTPSLKRMYARYSRADLEIVAVHTPEVPSYQSRLAYVAREARAAALPWPIAIDNGAHIWNAYGVSAWPTQLLFDRRGRLSATIVGDGQDARVESAVRSLMRPA